MYGMVRQMQQCHLDEIADDIDPAQSIRFMQGCLQEIQVWVTSESIRWGTFIMDVEDRLGPARRKPMQARS